ncbi:MAG TPA: HIT domain-containing protein [Tenericutes bacterium]|nr:HIT domain-containing protein [Mycoplasmatota bacterium]
MDCVFCKIIKGDIPCYSLYEDDFIKCFLDIFPDSNGHMLIIPKKHFTNLDDIDPETLIHIMNCAKEFKKVLEKKLNIDGLTLIQNNGEVQDVKHYHLHLKPYYKEKKTTIDVETIFQILTK